MLDSINRVTGTMDKDWEITYEPTSQRYRNGLDAMHKGAVTGFAKAMYSRFFYTNGHGDFESSRGLNNGLIGLPKEYLDKATQKAVDMVVRG